MMEKTEAGTAMLCRKLGLNCIKITMAKRPREEGGRLVYPYSIERGGIAVILEAIPQENRPDKYFNETELLCDEGDKLNGKKLWGCNDKPNRTCPKTVGEVNVRSGRHSRQGAEIKGDQCYIVIVSSWRGNNINILPLNYSTQETKTLDGTDNSA